MKEINVNIRKVSVFVLAALLITFSAFSQSAYDALLLSQNYDLGTARYTAMGGAFSSLGGDASAINSNPAGLAIYRTSEFTITPGFSLSQTDALHTMGTTHIYDTSSDIYLGNLAVVAAYETNEPDWKYVNVAFSINRKALLGNRYTAQSVNDISSMTDNFADNIAAGYQRSFYEDLAWAAILVDSVTINDSLIYYTDIRDGGYGETQRMISEVSGNATEYSFALGGNYKDMLYLGMSIDARSVKYKMRSMYSEFDENGAIAYFDSFVFEENLKSSSTGVNLKLGAIFRPVPFLRVAAALHTPTYMQIYEEFDTHLDNYFDNEVWGAIHHEWPAVGDTNFSQSDYEISTPLKAVLGASVLVGKLGLLSFDYEWVDYSMIRMASLDYDFFSENEFIRDQFQTASNLKAGAEVRLGAFSLRGGYSLYGTPVKQLEEQLNRNGSGISAGFGIKSGNLNIDVSWNQLTTQKTNLFYDAYDNEPLVGANVKTIHRNLQITMGIRF